MNAHRKTRELTGKHVLFCLLGFFGVVFAVNAVLVKEDRHHRLLYDFVFQRRDADRPLPTVRFLQINRP